jgi:hypothetical protein
MIISLVMDWYHSYFLRSTILPVIFNSGFMTGFCSALGAFVAFRLCLREPEEFYLPGITNQLVQYFYFVTAMVLFFIAGSLEINQQFVTRLPGTHLQFVYTQLYDISFVTVLMPFLKKMNIPAGRTLQFGIPLLVFIFYLFNTRNVFHSEIQLLTGDRYRIYFSGNWISAALFIWLGIKCISRARRNNFLSGNALAVLSVITTLSLVILFSVELRNLFIWLNFSGVDSIAGNENIYGRAGLSIIWGLSSFIIIWLGMKFRYKILRILALILFGITLLKLFIYDIRNIPPGGKIAAFILLGVLLLAISFMYQRLKRIIIDDRHPAA